MAKYSIEDTTLTTIGDAVRAKTGGTSGLTPKSMADALNGISERSSSDLTASGATVSVPAGNYKAAASKAVATATQATPSISVSTSGLITASATQTAGYVAAGTKSATKQMTVQAAQTITPGTSNKTIASGRYLTGTQTIKGDSNLTAANIKKGVSIFGVSGSYAGVELNFTVVGGTSQPSSPAENTIWVNTSTTISSYIFCAGQPSSPSSGRLWIKIGASSYFSFNALKTNGVYVYPSYAKQYINGAWVNKTAKIYKNGAWVSWSTFLYNLGDECTSVSGGWATAAKKYSSSGTVAGKAAAITRNNTDIYINVEGAGIFYCKNKINLSGISKIKMTGTFYSSSQDPENLGFYVWTKLGTYYSDNAVITYHVGAQKTVKTIELDVSSITGEHYVGFIYNEGSGGGSGYIKMETCELIQ